MDTTKQILTGVGIPILLAVVWWFHRRYLKPLAMLPAITEHLTALPTMRSDVRVIREQVARIQSEVQVNSGKTLKDDVHAIRNDLARIEARQRGLLAASGRAAFETDSDFNWIDVNVAVERLFGVGMRDLERRRWVSVIHDEDRADVQNEISEAVKDKRAAHISFRAMTEFGTVAVRLEATPIFSRIAPDVVICWSGTLTKIDDRRVEERRGH